MVTRKLTALLGALTLALAAAGCEAHEAHAAVEVREYVDVDHTTLRRTGDAGPIGDPEADRAFEYASHVVAYFKDRFGRDSFDGRGSALILYVRVPDYQFEWLGPASWDRKENVMRFDAGYATLDAIAHEFTHGLLHHTVKVERELDEAIADIFAVNVDDDWLIGEDWPIGHVRDLAEPAHINGYGDDAHANSLIASHAYYLLAVDVGRPTAEEIVWVAVTRHLEDGAGLEEFGLACRSAAQELYGAESAESRAVEEAFRAVGL